MEHHKTEITICLGSSCFARGNKQLVKIINEFLVSRGLQAQIHFKGERCFAHCSSGPVVKIGHTIHEKVDENSIIPLIESALNQLP